MIQQVDIDLARRVDQAHRPLAFRRHARRLEDRLETVVEIDLGRDLVGAGRGIALVRPVLRLGFQGRRVGTGQGQGQVEVVNHQVKHDRDVEITRRRRAVAYGFKPKRLFRHVIKPHRLELRALLVAARQNQAVLRRQVDHGLAVVGQGRQRLFAVDMHARRQRLQRDTGMGEGWCGDGQNLYLRQEIVEGITAERRDVELGGRSRGTFAVEVINADKLYMIRLLVLVGMIAAENAGSGDACFQLFHALYPQTIRFTAF